MCQTHRYLQQQKKVTIMMMMIVIIIIHLDKDLTTNVKNWYWIVWCDLCVNVYDNDDHIMFELWYQKKRKYWVVKSKVIRSFFFCYCIFHCSWNTYRAKRQYYCLFFCCRRRDWPNNRNNKAQSQKMLQFSLQEKYADMNKRKAIGTCFWIKNFFLFWCNKVAKSRNIYEKKTNTLSTINLTRTEWENKAIVCFIRLFVCLFHWGQDQYFFSDFSNNNGCSNFSNFFFHRFIQTAAWGVQFQKNGKRS